MEKKWKKLLGVSFYSRRTKKKVFVNSLSSSLSLSKTWKIQSFLGDSTEWELTSPVGYHVRPGAYWASLWLLFSRLPESKYMVISGHFSKQKELVYSPLHGLGHGQPPPLCLCHWSKANLKLVISSAEGALKPASQSAVILAVSASQGHIRGSRCESIKSIRLWNSDITASLSPGHLWSLQAINYFHVPA